MLRQPLSRISRTGRTEPPIGAAPDGLGTDRAMDVLQYAIAFLAIAVAVLLAVLR